MIPYGFHNLGEEEVEAVRHVLENGWLTQGSKIPEFENAFASYCQTPHACAVSSATTALHLSYLALGVNQKSLVWVPANTFVASSNAALMCSARVDFVDIDRSTGSINAHILESKLIQADKHNLLPDVVCVVHYAGHPVDMQAINQLAKKYQFKVIEDASHAVGAKYSDGRYVGACEYSDITVFSFHPVKIMTTAEGGMITSRSESLIKHCKLLRNHGIDKDLHSRGNSWEFDQVELGFNYRMTDIQAALGCVQLKKVNDFVLSRNKIADYYTSRLSDCNLELTLPKRDVLSSFHLYPIKVENRKQVFDSLREKGIGVSVHYRPVYLNTYYKNLGFKMGLCPAAESFYDTALSIPIFPSLNMDQQNYIVETIKSAL